MGDEGALCGRTYSAPRKWKRGKGRITVQMGCCYNYATDKQGRPPGILVDEPVNGLPPMLDDVVDRMVARRIFTSATRPDSCIINLYGPRNSGAIRRDSAQFFSRASAYHRYSEGDCIPPHIDHHDFVRPFVTLSLLSEQPILFGKEIKIVEDGIFDAPVRVALPVGSVLVLNGNGADVAKHCVPAVSGERVSITFRKMRSVTLGSKKRTVEYKGPDCAPPAVDFRVRA